jgi:hypothetical protein
MCAIALIARQMGDLGGACTLRKRPDVRISHPMRPSPSNAQSALPLREQRAAGDRRAGSRTSQPDGRTVPATSCGIRKTRPASLRNLDRWGQPSLPSHTGRLAEINGIRSTETLVELRFVKESYQWGAR